MTNFDMVMTSIADFMDECLEKLTKEEPLKSKLKELKYGLTCNRFLISDYAFFTNEMERMRNERAELEIADEEIDKDINEELVRCIRERDCLNRECSARTHATIKRYDEDVCVVNNISIYISSDDICRTMCDHPECSVGDIIDHYKLIVRHEFGHFIDYVMLNGTSYSEFKKRLEEETEISKGVYRRIDELREKADNDENISGRDLAYTCNRMYYEEIPAEKRANEYAKFTPEELERLYTDDDLN